MRYRLHSYRRCPFCIRVRILLALKSIPYEVVEEPLRTWTPWMRAWSERTGERARVPVLVTVYEDGSEEALPESNTINEFLDTENQPPTYTPEKDSDAYREMHEWFSWCDNELKHQIDIYKYGEGRVFDVKKVDTHKQTLADMLIKLENRVSNNMYLLENRLTLADIAIIPFVRQIMRTREGEFDFTSFPKVRMWTESLINTEWFEKDVMKKYPLASSEHH